MAQRKSAYHRDYTVQTSTTSYSFDGSIKTMKEKEKEQLKTLNNSLVNYIDKVHDLEMMIKRLSAENFKLRKSSKTKVQVDVSSLFEVELKRLRLRVQELEAQNVEISIKLENKGYEFEENISKSTETITKLANYEREVIGLRKDVDDATIDRAKMEGRIESLVEQLALERKVHEAELQNLQAQIVPVDTQVQFTEVEQSRFVLTDLTEAIANIRKEYEAFNAKSLEDLDRFYKEKVESLNKQLKTLQIEIRDVKIDNTEKRRRVQTLELELETIRQKKITLEKTIVALEARIAELESSKDAQLVEMRAQLLNTKQDLGKYLRQYQELNALKLSLDQEISIYRKLITGEEVRISEVDTSFQQIRSRSSSSSSSSSSSRSASIERSQISVTKKSRPQIVEEMMQTTTTTTTETSNVVMKGGQVQGSQVQTTIKSQSTPKGKGGKGVKQTDEVISVSWKIKGGTVRTKTPFDPDEDAEALHKAMKGLGTDEDTIIAILTKRTKVQRNKIEERYLAKYKKDLLKDLEGELSGNLLTTVQHLMWKKSVLDAQALRKAIKGFGTDEAVLIEILCTQSSLEINDIKKDYQTLFKRDLVNDVKNDTSSGFRDFLVNILKGLRHPDNGTVVAEEAEADAKQLFAIQVKNWNPSNPTFLKIFTQRSYQHLWYLFKECWPKHSKENLIETIDKQCKSDLRRGLRTIVRFSTLVPPKYYAFQAYDALSTKGVEDKQLIYILTLRSEVDLIDVKEEYERTFNKTLLKHLEDATKGKYQKILLSLCK